MRLTIGELFDRYTIEMRKEAFGHGSPEIIFAIEKEIREQYGENVAMVITSAVQLAVLNASIADNEWQLRAGVKLPLEEIGRRALAIRTLNSKRVAVKNGLSRFFGDPESPVYYGRGELKAEDLTLDIQEPQAT